MKAGPYLQSLPLYTWHIARRQAYKAGIQRIFEWMHDILEVLSRQSVGLQGRKHAFPQLVLAQFTMAGKLVKCPICHLQTVTPHLDSWWLTASLRAQPGEVFWQHFPPRCELQLWQAPWGPLTWLMCLRGRTEWASWNWGQIIVYSSPYKVNMH